MPIRITKPCVVAVLCCSLSPVFAEEPEFGKQCALGMSLGKSVPTDCSVNWKSGDGKTYCFSSEKAKSTFLSSTDDNLKKAQEHYAATQRQE